MNCTLRIFKNKGLFNGFSSLNWDYFSSVFFCCIPVLAYLAQALTAYKKLANCALQSLLEVLPRRRLLFGTLSLLSDTFGGFTNHIALCAAEQDLNRPLTTCGVSTGVNLRVRWTVNGLTYSSILIRHVSFGSSPLQRAQQIEKRLGVVTRRNAVVTQASPRNRQAAVSPSNLGFYKQHIY